MAATGPNSDNDLALFKRISSRLTSYDEKRKILNGLSAEQKSEYQKYCQKEEFQSVNRTSEMFVEPSTLSSRKPKQ